MKTLKRLRVGQRVRAIRPIELAARFYSGQHGGIVGAGYGCAQIVPRESLDCPATVVAVSGRGKTAKRGLVEFDLAGSMWLDAEVLTTAKKGKRQ